jgi:hypothetical protein
MTIQYQSHLTCPLCGRSEILKMRSDSCQYYYECRGCGSLLRPAAGDCCVFCSYGDVPCPPVQRRLLGLEPDKG